MKRRYRSAILSLIMPLALSHPLAWSDSPNEIKNGNEDAVVFISVNGVDDPNGTPLTSEGTGFLVSPIGHVIAAFHTFADENGKRINLANGACSPDCITGAPRSRHGFSKPLEIIKTEPEVDLVLLRFKGNSSDYKVVRICQQEEPEVGDKLAALGFPKGSDLSVIDGILSNKSGDEDLYQTNLAFVEGYSGGPVFAQKDGSLVGVVSGGTSSAPGRNFYRPIHHATNLLNMAPLRKAACQGNISTMFQSFEPDTHTPENDGRESVCRAKWRASCQFESQNVHTGARSIRVNVQNPRRPQENGGTIRLFPSSREQIDLSSAASISVWVYDTQDNNTVQLKLCDEHNCSNEVWSEDPSVRGEWAEISWPISKFSDIDKRKVTAIEIFEWNDGVYYFDDVRWR